MKQIETHPPNISGFRMSRLIYVLHLILTHKQDKHPGSYSVLKMKYIDPVIPSAALYFNFLRDEKIIEWKNHLVGRNSRLYRLVNEGPTEYRTLTDKQLINRIEKASRTIKNHNSKKYPALNEYIHKVSIDTPSALKIIQETYLKNLKTDLQKAEGRRTFSLSEIEKIQAGEIYIKVNSTNGRLDSNFTRLPSELVQHLRIDGCSLVELDICNSQPFFAACLLDPTPEIENIINRICGKNFTIALKTLQLTDCEDVERYTALVTSCDFYNPYFVEKFKQNGIQFRDRADLKEQMFIIFFGKNNAIHFSPAVQIFRSDFPHVYELFRLIKREEHNRLAILLQKIEAHVILDRVAQRILSELPGLPFITRHDSLLPSVIMVTGQTDKVCDIMEATIEEVTGLKPFVRVKATLPSFYNQVEIKSNIKYTLSP